MEQNSNEMVERVLKVFTEHIHIPRHELFTARDMNSTYARKVFMCVAKEFNIYGKTMAEITDISGVAWNMARRQGEKLCRHDKDFKKRVDDIISAVYKAMSKERKRQQVIRSIEQKIDSCPRRKLFEYTEREELMYRRAVDEANRWFNEEYAPPQPKRVMNGIIRNPKLYN